MKPAPFDYRPARSAEEAGRLLGATPGAKAVAGAMSLGPMLNLRLARPSLLVDVAMLPELRAHEETADGVWIGAGATHAEIEDGEAPDPTGGWLRAAAADIAHRAVRTRGTLGGSLAHADPAADWLIVLTGLGARLRVEGPGGRRELAVDALATGPFQTALAPDELILAVFAPRPAPGARWGYWKYARQVGEFAKASAAVLIAPEAPAPRIAIGALGGPPRLLAPSAGAALLAGDLTSAEAIADLLPERPAPDRALHATALARALARARSAETAP